MKNILLLLIIALVSYAMGFHFGKGNQTLRYGDTGLPKNCRALIADNINGVSSGEFSYLDALNSIDRNCGINGFIWNER